MTPKWRVDQRELEEARYFYGLEYPVVILATEQGYAGKYHGIGYYGPAAKGRRLDVPTHQFSLTGDMAASSANNIAWHELTHAFQVETFLPEVPEGEEYDPALYGGLERHEVALRAFTDAYAAEGRACNGFSTGSHGMNGSYSSISFEKEAMAGCRYSKEVNIIVPADGEWEEPPIKRWRVDVTPFQANKYPFGYSTRYVLSSWEAGAVNFVIDEYRRERNIRIDNWDVHAYECPLEPGDLKEDDEDRD